MRVVTWEPNRPPVLPGAGSWLTVADEHHMTKSDAAGSADLSPRPGHVPFESLGLTPEVLRAVAQLGFEETSPIQAAAIPLLMAGHDVVGQSETGSGKTAAF